MQFYGILSCIHISSLVDGRMCLILMLFKMFWRQYNWSKSLIKKIVHFVGSYYICTSQYTLKNVKLIISFAYIDTQNVPPRCARLQDVIAWVTVSTKYCINTCPIINRYIATWILKYVRDCSRNISVRLFYQAVKIKWKLCMAVTTQKGDTSLNILYHVCPTTPQKRQQLLPYSVYQTKRKLRQLVTPKKDVNFSLCGRLGHVRVYNYVTTRKEENRFWLDKIKERQFSVMSYWSLSKRSPLLCTHSYVLLKRELQVSSIWQVWD